MHTKDILAGELIKAGLPEMAAKAAEGWYHDFLSPLATPELQLAADLAAAGTPEALALRQRVINGDFDASREESDAWARSPEGQKTFDELRRPINRAQRRKAGERGTPERAREQVGRVAFRQEGDFWNAYYAMPDTMDGALLLGSFHMKFATSRPERKEAFITLMRAAVGDIIEEKFGTRPMWPDPPSPAPEHERG